MLDVIVTISWQMRKITIPLIYTVLTSIMVPDGDDYVEVWILDDLFNTQLILKFFPPLVTGNNLEEFNKLNCFSVAYVQWTLTLQAVTLFYRQSKKSEQLEFYFGLNANERYHDGMFFYNADRLVKMYVKEGTMQSKEEM